MKKLILLGLLASTSVLSSHPLVVALRSSSSRSAPRSNNSSTLRGAAEGRIYMGSAISNHWYTTPSSEWNKNYSVTFSANYDLSTAENECKWAATQPQEGVFNFSQCDQILRHTTEANAMMRLHNLCWGVYNPKWLTSGNFKPPELKKLLQKHVTAAINHYKNSSSVIGVDVVNEAISDGDASQPLFKPADPWYPAVPNYVEVAFRAAAAARGNRSKFRMKLFYNEYSIHNVNPKSDRVYTMAKDFLSKGIPLEGLGIQMHVSGCSLLNTTSMRANMIRFKELGLDIHITEMDAKIFPYFCNDQTQAEVYRQVLSTCLEKVTMANGKVVQLCQSFETWEFNDQTSWLNLGSTFWWNKLHWDVKPLPFRGDFTPRAAYFALLDELLRKNSTSEMNY